jgi:FkbM family methyltransferase
VVYRQVFVDQEYGGTCGGDSKVETIVDLGANVGYASVFLLSKYPRARVVAVEPDPENFALLRRNLAPYRNRCKLLLAAAWSHPTRLRMRAEPFRGGGHWARQVEPGDDGTVEAMDLGTLFSKLAIENVSILKIDIEGAEVAVFSGNLDWIDRVDSIVIELHDDSSFGPASEKIILLLEGAGFGYHRRGELTVFQRTSAQLASVP